MDSSKIVVGATLGPGVITIAAYGAAKGTGVNLGLTDGGVSVEPKTEVYEVEVDNSTGVIKRKKTKESLIIKMSIADATFQALQMALGQPASYLSGQALTIGGDIALPEYTVYIDVVGISDGARPITIYKANVVGDAKHTYKKKDKTLIPIEVHALMDLSRTVGDQLWSGYDAAGDTTPPTIVLSTPAPGGTVTKNTKGTVVLTITEANNMNLGSMVYGDEISIVKVTTPSAPALVPGTIAYDPTAKTITFTPTSNWTASDVLEVVVTTGLKDAAGNRLAAPYVAEFTVTA